ncbi:MAG: hypothetical protein E4H13_03850 [Calditrichales bacterium]|nr:MAG: hypothetical protein E4H13_03850 [Calditrichales bacterium]
MAIKVLISVLTLIFLVTGCSFNNEPPEAFSTGIEKIKMKWAPEKRTAVFDVVPSYADGEWTISGETTVPEAWDAIDSLVKEIFAGEKIVMDFALLPPAEFADTTQAVVNVSVGNLRREPRHAAELVDQVVMGMELKLLKAKSYWYFVQTPSGYLGWITRGSLTRMGATEIGKWRQADKYVMNENLGHIYSKPSEGSQVVTDLVLGSVFIKKEGSGTWREVELPDGRAGFVHRDRIVNFQEANNRRFPDRKAIVDRAKTMMGVPYLWGGNSTKGLDCSGFSGTVYRAEGYQLPRDANMQVKEGEEVVPNADYANVFPGDLIFFGPPDRVTHVGICLGGSYFIHSSDDVHINSLDEKDELFNAYRKRTFRHIKRIIKD